MAQISSPPEFIRDPVERQFWAHVEVDPESGCWLWRGNMKKNGYGRITTSYRTHTLVHRYAYVLLVGPIPPGLVIDHLCRATNCVNPKHLEAVTNRVNIQRGNGSRYNSTKTHCPKGHPYDASNTFHNKKGHRICRECSRVHTRRFKAANPEKVRASDRASKRRAREKARCLDNVSS